MPFRVVTGDRRSRVGVDPAALAAAIGTVAFLTITGAWAFEWAGYVPCELCLKERIPYYGGVPLAALVAVLARRGRTGLLPAGFAALGLIFAAGAGLSGYHAGVEWGVWSGPASCAGRYDAPAQVSDFLHQLQHVSVVRCDAAALRIGGISLAGWDALISSALGVLAGIGLAETGRR